MEDEEFDTNPRPTFRSADTLFAWMDRLPGGPSWRYNTQGRAFE